MFYLYILKSIKDYKGYVGTSSDVCRRLQEHNSGYVRSTKNRRPFMVVHTEEFETQAEARKREWFYKCIPQGGKLKKKILEMA